MPLTQSHTTPKSTKAGKTYQPFMRWATARCPQCGLPIHDWLPIAIHGPTVRMAQQKKK